MRRERLFFVIALLLPVLLFGGLEVGLRLFWKSGWSPLFQTAPVGEGRWLVANPTVASRWFATERQPPAADPELFAVEKPANGFRVVVMGESSAQGFPWPRNGSFPRVLRSVLRDALPKDSVEVINLGIAATNSFAMLDLVDEVIAQRPDAVLIYAGHNEYYGVFGAASSEGFGAPTPSVTRGLLRLQRLRTVMLARRWAARLRAPKVTPGDAQATASFMESVARDRNIVLDGPGYQKGVTQYEENLGLLVGKLRGAGISVFLASIPGNVRDQAPFASDGNSAALAAFQEGAAALRAGDTATARTAYLKARDLDVVRFRAPTAFRAVTQRVASASGAIYVPVAEAFDSVAPGGIPGAELFLEHVHPTARGYSLVARTFWEAMRQSPALAARIGMDKVRDWTAYESARHLTPYDERIVAHRVATLTARWPFVPVLQQRDYRQEYRPVDLVDSTAFEVAAGMAPWEMGKFRVAESFEKAGAVDAAVEEYRGLMVDLAGFEAPARLAGMVLVRAGRFAEGDSMLARAMSVQVTSAGAAGQGFSFAQQKRWPEAIEALQKAVQLDGRNVEAFYRLSLAYALSGDPDKARASALELARRAPGYPPLQGWLEALGLRR